MGRTAFHLDASHIVDGSVRCNHPLCLPLCRERRIYHDGSLGIHLSNRHSIPAEENGKEESNIHRIDCQYADYHRHDVDL